MNKAKNIIKKALSDNNFSNRVTGKTVGFSDLARSTCIFVTVHGWNPNPFAGDLEKLGRENGFRVDFTGAD